MKMDDDVSIPTLETRPHGNLECRAILLDCSWVEFECHFKVVSKPLARCTTACKATSSPGTEWDVWPAVIAIQYHVSVPASDKARFSGTPTSVKFQS